MNNVEEAIDNNGLNIKVDFQGGKDDLKSTPFLGDSGLAPDFNPATGEVIAWNLCDKFTDQYASQAIVTKVEHEDVEALMPGGDPERPFRGMTRCTNITFDHEEVSNLPYLNGEPAVVAFGSDGHNVYDYSPKRGETSPVVVMDKVNYIPKLHPEGAGVVCSAALPVSARAAHTRAADMIKDSGERGIHIESRNEDFSRLGNIVHRFPSTEEQLKERKKVWDDSIDNVDASEYNIQRARLTPDGSVDVTKFNGASQVDYLTIDSIGSAFDNEEVTITPEDELKLGDELNVFEFMAKTTPGFKRDLDFEKRMMNNQLDLTNPEEITKLQAYMQLVQTPMDIENLVNKAAHDKMKKKSRGNKTRWRDIKKGR